MPIIEDDETIFPFPQTERVSELYTSETALPMQRVLFDQAIGLISAETVIPYPPGIPWILKGERIKKKKIRVLREWISLGRKLQASKHVMIEQIDVIVEEF
ncbi:hypothetical protein [Exiguobacterium profundum]|uniref:Orn/Lys/Arg family decarboxylase n=1 Tax=Exiguobacterium profundum TaxID=307643 RepID=UPI000AF45BD6|nr:hypothetical protein [Exiguobacterium profundum]